MPLPKDIAAQWKAAATEERALRSAAAVAPGALAVERDGIRAGPLRLRHIALLDAILSPFAGHDTPVTPEEIIRAWLIVRDLDYTRNAAASERDREIAFAAGHLATITSLLCDLLDMALRDMPPAQGHNSGGAAASPIATLIDLFASEYGWRLDDILDLPMPLAAQLLRAILRRKNPDVALGNPSDRVLTEYLNKQQSAPHAN